MDDMGPDGSKIAHITTDVRLCETCHQVLAAVSWVVPGGYPRAQCEGCVDWSARPFPFQRQLHELRKMARSKDAPGRAIVVEVGRALAAHEARWPAGGAAVVAECRGLVSAAKGRLSHAGVEAKVVSRL